MGRGLAVVAAVLACFGASCTSEGSDEVVAAPSVLADAAEGIDSGRMETFDDDGRSAGVWEFEGENQRLVLPDGLLEGEDEEGFTGAPGDPEALDPEPAAAPEELLTVDSVTYRRSGGSERWTRFPDDGSDVFVTEGLSEFLAAVTELVVVRPGERTERDGVEVTRFIASLDGAEAERLFAAIGPEGPGGAAGSGDMAEEGDSFSGDVPSSDVYSQETAELLERGDRVGEYFAARTTYEFAGEIDGSGRLVRLEMEMAVDTSEYPDCEATAILGMGRVVLTELGEPQGMVAPPADLVDEEPSFGLDDPSAEDEPSGGDEEPMLDTASGPRPTWAVLEYLRSWADAQGIDWQSLPLPDETQMVVLFDQFYARDLAERGPALETFAGPFPRGHVVDVVVANADWLEVDSTTAASLPDAELVGLFAEAGGVGAFAPGGDAAPPEEVPGEGGVVTAPPSDEGLEQEMIADLRTSFDEMYAGCPA